MKNKMATMSYIEPNKNSYFTGIEAPVDTPIKKFKYFHKNYYSWEEDRRNTKFIRACQENNLELAKKLIDDLDEDEIINIYYKNCCAYSWAVINNNLEMVKWLASIGDFEQKESSQLPYPQFSSIHPISKACANGNLEMVKLLYSIDPKPVKWYNYEAICWAYKYKHYEIVEWLCNQINNSSKVSFNPQTLSLTINGR